MEWRKSSFCARDQPMCVEVAETDDGQIAVRSSVRPGPAVIFTKAEMSAFLNGVKDNEFDDLIN